MRSKISRLLVCCAVLVSMLLPCAAWSQDLTDDVSILILPFEINAESKLNYLQANLPNMIAERLAEEGFTVVSQEKTRALIKSKKVKYLDLATAKDLARSGDAQYALYGSVSQAGQSLSFDARLVQAMGLKPTKALFVTKEGAANVVAAVDDLVRQVRGGVSAGDVVTEVKIQGVKVLDKDVVLMRMKQQKGDPYDPSIISEDIKRIFDLGYFDDVKISVEDGAAGKILIVDVVEKPRIQAIGVVGGGDVDEDDVLEVMSIKKGSLLNPKILADDLGKIRELLRKEGYYLAKVKYELENTGKGTARLNIVIEQAEKQYISEIKFEGNTTFDDGDLSDELALEERNIISWITGGGVLHEEMLDRDAAAIEEYYANHGFIQAKVAQPKVEFLEDGIHITFIIIEGARYRVGLVEFGGDLLVDSEKLAQISKMDDLAADGEYFNRSVVRTDTQRLTNYYNDFGYAYADVDVKTKINDAESTVDLLYDMRKNQKVYIRRVMVEGNNKTRDNVIRRELALADGDTFSGTRLKLSNRRLEKLDLFESADIETVQTENPNEVDLKVKIKEKATGSLAGGVGYSSYTGAYVGVKLAEKNLFGKGYMVDVSASFSAVNTQYQINLLDPRFMDSQFSIGTSAYWTTYVYPDFDKDTIGGALTVSYPLGEHTRAYLGYRLDWYDIRDLNANAAESIKDMEKNSWASVATLSAIRDDTNRKVNPSAGSKNSIQMDYGGGLLMGDDDFIKIIGDTSWYYELPFLKEHILHAHGQAGILMENFTGDDPPVFEHFFLGGMQSIRGYDTRKIAPRDSSSGDYIGGNKQFFINLEYIFPLQTEYGLVGLAFFDMGDSWRGDIGDVDIKKSIGAGIRWFSPMGPLRLEYGYGMDEIYDQDGQHKIEFSVGQFF